MKKILAISLFILWTLTLASASEFTRGQAGKIAQVVGRILERHHYKQARLNDDVAEKTLKNYLDALDYNHLIFLQTDVEEFDKRFGKNLDDATLEGDATAAFIIYDHYLARLRERHEVVRKLLKEKYDFTKDEAFLAARNKLPWPADAAEAERLWRFRVKFDLLEGRLAKEKPEETVNTVAKRFDRLVRTMADFGSEEILQIYLTALAHVYDPHSEYMGPIAAENFEINKIKLSLSGIGAELRSDDGYARVIRLLPGGPAEMSKQLKPNDRIIAIAQGDGQPVDAVEMKLSKVVELIRGPRGTEVRLTVIPAGSNDGSIRKVIRLVRDEIKLSEQKAKATIIERPDGAGVERRIGVVALAQFYENSAQDVERLLERLKKENVSGVVLDLRRNAGGILPEAVKMTGHFITQGPVVQVQDGRKRTQVLADQDSKIAYDGPLVVLVGRLSASASEIVAAALQDYGRALIVGDQSTHGKGTVQSVLPLNQVTRLDSVPDLGKFKLTVSKFYRISGRTTQRIGVTPDIILPSINDYLDLGEASMENSLPDDQIAPLEYARSGKLNAYLLELQKRSAERVRGSTDFRYLNEDIEVLKKQRAEKTVSLNEARRLQERSEKEGRLNARKQERAQRKPLTEKVFEITLDAAEHAKPLQLFTAGKQKEEDPLVEAGDLGANARGEVELEPPVDLHLEEAIRILHDYNKLSTITKR